MRRRCRAWPRPARVQIRLWAQPTLAGKGHRQVLLSSHDGHHGFALALTGAGHLELSVGDAAVALAEPVRIGAWHQIVADIGDGALRLSAGRALGLPANTRAAPTQRAERRVDGLRLGFTGPVVMAASAAAARCGPLGVGDHFTGKLEAPEILAGGKDLRSVAAWDLGADVPSDHVPDRGPDACHARAWSTGPHRPSRARGG